MSTIAEGGTSFSQGSISLLQGAFQFTTIDHSNIITIATSFVSNILPAITGLLSIIFLWFPTVWEGYFIWFWYLICVPLGAGMCWAIMIILRGVPNL